MCGIGGILRIQPAGMQPLPPEAAISESWLDVLDDSIRHRGPDGQGRFRDRVTRADGSVVDVAFVHRRLSIIDHAGGRQPMVSERGPWTEKPRNGRVAVVFNGCIYNHRELRRELLSAGHRFASDHSDTEVLIHGWRLWGQGLFAKLDGMFAVAIWDAATGSLITARDAFGEKPLYASETNGLCVFASTAAGVVRTLRASGRSDATTLHPARVGKWTRFGWDRETPFTHGSPRDPGKMSVAPNDAGPGRVGESWMGSWREADRRRTDSVSVDEVDTLLASAVASRLEADVPVGVFLSGGIDSALVAHYASRAAPQIEAFTVRMPEASLDESEAAAATAARLGIKHRILDCAPDPAHDLVRLVEQLGLPFGDSSILPSFWVSNAARKAVPVALGGDGGDELFLGYERHRAIGAISALRRLPAAMTGAAAGWLGGPASKSPRLRKAARLLDASAHAGYEDLVAIFPASLLRPLIGEHAFDATRPRAGDGWPTDGEERCERSSLEFDLLSYLPEDLLRKTDSASMAVGLEVRAPFLARELAGRMIRVRPDLLMPDGERKGLLKQVARLHLPDSIVERPKMGFSIPIGEWFRSDYGGMKQLLLDTINGPDPFPEDVLGITINRRIVATMVEDHMSRRRDHSQRLYMLLVLAIWARWLRGV